MDFQDFISCIPKITATPLLALEAHALMMPPERAEMTKESKFEELKARKAAVMMLVYPKENQAHLILILRNSYHGIHSSQIAFPGGKVELEDASIQHAALRETYEEIGISANIITVIKPFTEVYIPPSNFIVYPFLGYSSEALYFIPDANEVAGLIELPIADFLNENTVVNKMMATSYSKETVVPAFKIKEYFVWGATAMMLSELKEMLKKVI